MAITDENKSTIERLKELKSLYEAGILSKEEMEAEKAEILGTDKPKDTSTDHLPPHPSTTPPMSPTPAINAEAEDGQDIDYDAYINEEEPFWHSTKGTVTIITILAVAIVAVIFGVRQCGSGNTSGAYGAVSLSADTSYTDTTNYTFENEPVNEFKHIKEVKGNLDVDIQWPLALEGVDDIKQLQRCIIDRVGISKTNDINTCIDDLSEELRERDAEEGNFTVKYKGKLGDWHVFNINLFVNWGVDVPGILIGDMYYDNELGRDLTFADIAKSEDSMNNFLNYYWDSVTPPSNEWFEITPNGIIFTWFSPINADFSFFLDYYEMDDILSETFKKKVNKIIPDDKWVTLKFSREMNDPDVEDSWPIEISFQRKGQQIRNCIYKNVRIGGKIHMKGEVAGDYFILTGKDGTNDFRIMLNKKMDEESTAFDGTNELTITSEFG